MRTLMWRSCFRIPDYPPSETKSGFFFVRIGGDMAQWSNKVAAVALLVFIACLAMGGCEKESNPAAITEPANYEVYFWDGLTTNWYFAYRPETNQLDSFSLPVAAENDIEVSADGKRLFIGRNASIPIVDLETRAIVGELPYGGGVVASPDGRWLAVLGDGWRILRASDYGVVFEDTIVAVSGAFSADGDRFYCVVGDGNSGQRQVRILDIADNFAVTAKSFIEGGLVRIIPSRDETRWFLYFNSGRCSSQMAVYDLGLDSIIFRHTVTPGKGDIELTPNGGTLFYSSPGVMLDLYGCSVAPAEFYAYDVSVGQDRAISTRNAVAGKPADYLKIGGLAVTPDGRWLVASMAEGGNVLAAIDLTTFTVAKYVELGGGRQFISLTCRKSL
jgi:hypothetical protein